MLVLMLIHSIIFNIIKINPFKEKQGFLEKKTVVGPEEPYDGLKPIISRGVWGPAPLENF